MKDKSNIIWLQTVDFNPINSMISTEMTAGNIRWFRLLGRIWSGIPSFQRCYFRGVPHHEVQVISLSSDCSEKLSNSVLLVDWFFYTVYDVCGPRWRYVRHASLFMYNSLLMLFWLLSHFCKYVHVPCFEMLSCICQLLSRFLYESWQARTAHL